jgi:transcriptional regulator with XRE-family HTH domain
MDIRTARLISGMTQKQLAEKAGIAQAHLSRLEAGKGEIYVSQLKKIAKVLKVKPADIMDKPKPNTSKGKAGPRAKRPPTKRGAKHSTPAPEQEAAA